MWIAIADWANTSHNAAKTRRKRLDLAKRFCSWGRRLVMRGKLSQDWCGANLGTLD